MLRIGFDAKRAFLNHTGLGNYSRSVIGSLARFFPSESYFLYTPRIVKDSRTLPMLQPAVTLRSPRLPVLTSAWRSRFVVPQLKRDRLDIYHGLSHELPAGIQYTGIKTLVTIHDLIFLRYPQYYKAADRKIYELKFRHACKHADRIIAISEQTKRDIVHYFGTAPDKIHVVYQTCDPAFGHACTPEQLQQVSSRYALPAHYLLYVGTIEERKNLMLIARALSMMPHEHLVVVGKPTAYAEKVKTYLKEHHIEGQVTFLERVPFPDLPALYQRADIFIYPSEFEGFGIPLLEALYSGVPAIGATGSCLEEAGGPGSIYVSPENPQALADAIRLIQSDKQQRQQMIQTGKQYASGFTEEAHAGRLMEHYRQLAAE
ncbi:glycosyltransferase family 4 protein [Taibaiella koreensis]|uniref:glycosyltransferase family 4 protein n=1 Tax=Taibaiella koreensis TaxID=1268548 RepID=UPI000E59EEF1|nr:glycosyltransferase family 1 protein [Taibaiella koreensis]